MTPGCPWVNWREIALPNIKYCEQTLCQWVSEPANSWSNIGYLLVGVLFFWIARNEKSKALRYYGPAAIWVACTSFLFHMSVTYFFQVADYLGMFLYFYLLLIQNLIRLGKLKQSTIIRNVWGTSLLTLGMTYVTTLLHFPVQLYVVFLIIAILVTETMIYRRLTRAVDYGYFFGSITAIGAAAVFSALDLSRQWCHPEQHFLQGHALWHLFGALALLLSYFHYRQFYDRETGEVIASKK